MGKTFWMGVAGGVIASRLLPPLFAQMRGAAGSIAGEDPFARLIQEHRSLVKMLWKMESIPATRAGKRMFYLLAFKRMIAKHAMAEEDVVYPLLHERADRQEAAEKLYKEHGSMKVHLFMLQESMNDDEQWRQHVRVLREEISRHAQQEEEEEFPRVRALREAESTALSRNLRQEEALIL